MREAPLDIGQHANHQFEILQAVYDKPGGRRFFNIFEQLLRRCDDIFGRQSSGGLSGLLHDQLKMTQIVIAEFK